MPNTSMPSPVNVPVLSKHINFTLPATLILAGEIQKISLRFRADSAALIPTVIAKGKEGGTTIVIKSVNGMVCSDVCLMDEFNSECMHVSDK
jgi:hypothetical protein